MEPPRAALAGFCDGRQERERGAQCIFDWLPLFFYEARVLLSSIEANQVSAECKMEKRRGGGSSASASTSREGAVSFVSHLALAGATALETMSDPMGAGSRCFSAFIFVATISNLAKWLTKVLMVASGRDDRDAFWRRPRAKNGKASSSLAYHAESCGFPSSHAANATAMWIYLAQSGNFMRMVLPEERSRLFVAVVASASMGFGRMLDGAHTHTQVFAGLALGTCTGVLSMTYFGAMDIPTPLNAIITLAVPAYHLKKTWQDSWSKIAFASGPGKDE